MVPDLSVTVPYKYTGKRQQNVIVSSIPRNNGIYFVLGVAQVQ
jgi:hypothetical protein